MLGLPVGVIRCLNKNSIAAFEDQNAQCISTQTKYIIGITFSWRNWLFILKCKESCYNPSKSWASSKYCNYRYE